MTENQRTILIIDDCPEDRETYRRYLQAGPIRFWRRVGKMGWNCAVCLTPRY